MSQPRNVIVDSRQQYNELMAEAPLKPKVASPRAPRDQAPKKRASVDAPTAAHPSDPRKPRFSAPTATATVARPSPSPSIVQPSNHAARHSLPAQAPQLPSPRRTPTPAQPKPFVSSLSSFLLSLHPSLPPIGPLLFGAGVSDHERLTHFIGLQETTREKLLLAAGVGPLQRGMVKGRLKSAKARGWAVEA